MIEALKKGKVDFKSDDGGNIHAMIGKRSFDKEKLAENYKALLEALNQNKPVTVKGKLIKNITLSATMTPGIRVS
jgi:large subunit ribosomal protein L1